MKDILWNKIILNEFIDLACLSETEEKVLRTMASGWSRTKQSMEFNMSISSVDAVISTLRKKYDSVQPYSSVLPVRSKK